MRLNFAEYSEGIIEHFETKEKYMNFSKLCVHAAKGKVEGHSLEEANSKILKVFREMAGLPLEGQLSKKEVKKALRKQAVREACFEILEDTLEDALISGWQASPFFQKYVDTKTLALGDRNQFYVKDNCVLTVSEIADGHHSINRQRLGKGRTFSVTVKTYGAKVYMEMTRFLQGVEDWTELIGKIAEAFTNKINTMIHNIFVSAGTTLPSADLYNVTGSLTNAKYADFVKLINDVKIATGSGVTIIGTSVALGGLKNLGDVAWISNEAKNDVYNTGRLGTFEGTPLVELPQGFVEGVEGEYLEADDKIFIFPNNLDKFIKFYYEGAEETTEVSEVGDNADDTKEYEFKNRFGLEAITNVRFGTWTIAGE